MRNPTITELNNTIEIMRKAYSFKDDEAYISLETNPCNHRCEVVNISTIDNATGTEVTLEKEIEWRKEDEAHRRS